MFGYFQFGGAKCGLLFSCGQKTMERRVLNRSQTSNRGDDNLETLRKRFCQHDEETMPCVDELRERDELVEVTFLDCRYSVDEFARYMLIRSVRL